MQRGGSRGGARGGAPSLFFDKNEAWRAKKNCFGDRPPLSQGLDDWVPPPPLIWRSGSTTVQWKEKTRSVCFDQKLRTFPHLFSNVFLTYLTASLTGIYLQTFEFVCPNLLLPVPINQVIVMEISLLVLWLGLIAVKFSQFQLWNSTPTRAIIL